MALVDVRRLAAVDMYGLKGSRRRRRIIRAEFDVGVVGCCALGVLAVARSSGWGAVLGVWLISIGLNYVPLALAAHALSRPGALEAELEGVDMAREIRRTGTRQVWILVPFAVVVSAVLPRRAG
jgi:hypothetical protein